MSETPRRSVPPHRLRRFVHRVRAGRLRLRLIALTLLSVVLAVGVVGVLVHVTVAGAEDRRLRSDAVAQLQEALTVMGETGVAVFRSTIDDPSIPSAVLEEVRGGSVVSWRHGSGEDEAVSAATSISPSHYQRSVLSVSVGAARSSAMLAQLDRSLMWAGVGSSIVVTIAAGWVATRLTRRLSRAALAARALPERVAGAEPVTGLAQTLGGASGHPDEVDRLVEAVDVMASRLRSRLEAEQRFTGDLAHELRTPLTGLVMAASLLEDSRPAQLVQERTDRLRTLVEDLLEVSRFEAGADQAVTEPADLLRAVRAAVRRAAEEGVPWAEEVTVTPVGPGASLVWLEQRRVDRIVSNLIKNAAAHGERPLRVHVRGASLVVQDSGPGYPAHILLAGPSRFVTKGGGWGLGLTIARGQAQVQGASFDLGTAEGGGASTTVTFRRAQRRDASERA